MDNKIGTGPGGPQFEDVKDVLRHQFGRRGVLSGGAALALGGLLSACSGGGGSYSDQGPEDKPKSTMSVKIGKANIPTPREKTVVIAQVDYTVYDSFNGMIPNGTPSGSGFDTMVKEGMFYLNLATGELLPWLCTKYTYNDKNTELTFEFNPEAKWNDGKPLTSADLKFTLDLLRTRKDLLGGGGDLSDFITKVDTPDPQTAVIQLNTPNPRFHYQFICVIAGGFDIRPKHIWEGQDPTKFKDSPPVRSGPYMLDQAIRSQKMFVWKKNPNYWNKANLDPKPEFVIFQSTAKQADSAALAFERAEFDVGSIDEEHAKQLRSKGYPALQTTQFNDPCPRAIWLNNDPKRGIISEPKMHWVVNHLIDRDKIGNNIWPVKVPGAQYPWANYPSNDKWTNDELAKKYEFRYDPKRAVELLDEIAPKGGDGKRMYKGKPATVEMITGTPVDGFEYVIAKLIKDELVKVGINATLRSLSGSVNDEKNQRGEFDITSSWVCDVSNDPEQMYRNLESDRAKPLGTNAVGKNTVRFKNADLDRVSKKLANLDPESEEAKPLLDEALEIYFQHLPVIPIIQTGYPSYYNTTFWKGWPTDDDLYQVPLNWWGQFMFILGKLEPTGQEAP